MTPRIIDGKYAVDCHFKCNYGPCFPGTHGTVQLAVGWQRIAGTRLSGKHGGSDIIGRETREVYAHEHCARGTRDGINVGQDTLL